jgi:hypothetical protein
MGLMGAILSWVNAAEAPSAEISATSDVTGLGIRSVLTPQIADVYRSGVWSGGSTVSIILDLGLIRTDLRLIVLAWPRDGQQPSPEARIRAIGSTSAPGGADAFNSGLLPLFTVNTGLWVYLLPQATVARYVRFNIQSGAADSYLQLGRIWAGPALVSSKGVAYGQQRGYLDAGGNERAGVSGVRYATRGAVRRKAQWQFPSLREADALALDALALSAGTTGQVFGSPFETTPARDGLFGHFTEPPSISCVSFQRWSASISIEEDL